MTSPRAWRQPERTTPAAFMAVLVIVLATGSAPSAAAMVVASAAASKTHVESCRPSARVTPEAPSPSGSPQATPEAIVTEPGFAPSRGPRIDVVVWAPQVMPTPPPTAR